MIETFCFSREYEESKPNDAHAKLC
jgi:hypothetical protein